MVSPFFWLLLNRAVWLWNVFCLVLMTFQLNCIPLVKLCGTLRQSKIPSSIFRTLAHYINNTIIIHNTLAHTIASLKIALGKNWRCLKLSWKCRASLKSVLSIASLLTRCWREFFLVFNFWKVIILTCCNITMLYIWQFLKYCHYLTITFRLVLFL